MDFTEKRISREHIYTGGIFELYHDKVLLPDGKQTERDCVYHNGGAGVVAVTDEDEILFVRQYRYVCSEETLEIPAGKLEKGEDPYYAALRELEEETGAKAKHMEKIAECYSTPGFCSEKLHLYFAGGLTFGKQSLDPEEFLNVVKIPSKKAIEMAKNGEFRDLKTAAGVLYYAAFKKAAD